MIDHEPRYRQEAAGEADTLARCHLAVEGVLDNFAVSPAALDITITATDGRGLWRYIKARKGHRFIWHRER